MYKSKFKKIISKAPRSSAVYFFKDDQGAIIYIGKAKDLYARLTSYHSQVDMYEKALILVEETSSLEWILTATEIDAMLLEATLIRQHKPKCNVLLKEGRPFLYFMITKDQLPLFLLIRNEKEKGLSFGPFIDKKSTRKVFSFLLKKFRLKICNKKIKNGCIDYHLGICSGFCLEDFDSTLYKKRVGYLKTFLKKGYTFCQKELEKELRRSNKNLTFEYSKELVELIHSLEVFSISLDSKVLGNDSTAYRVIDVWVYNSESLLLTHYQEEGGVLTSRASWYFESERTADGRLLYQEYFLSYYREQLPTEVIITNFSLEDTQLMENFLVAWHALKVGVTVILPTKGHYFQIIKLAEQTQKKMFLQSGEAAKQIQKICKLKNLPKNIDCFDISHNQGTVLVGASVRFTDGKPNQSEFRNFIIRSFQGNNDCAALQEIVGRRYKKKEDFPDLMLIDGGKGQRNAVKNLYPDLVCVSLAKKEERLFTDAYPDGMILDCKTAAGQLFIALRDYTHHVAITFHRKRVKNERLLKE